MSSDRASKRPRMDTTAFCPKTIGTHDGHFHCDEALACYLLRLLPGAQDAVIVRSRKPEVLAPCDVVVDVGGVFDPATHRYDHHQREFKETLQSLEPAKRWTTKLSSAGLVYKHFGREVISAVTGCTEEATVETLFDKVYDVFVEEIDAVDNGVNQYEAGTPRYTVSSTVSRRVGNLSPPWNAEGDTTAMEAAGFEKAMVLVGTEFTECVQRCYTQWLPARNVVKQSLEARFEVDPSGEVMLLAQRCPWKAHLYALETELSAGLDAPVAIKYVVFGGGDDWRVMCVSVRADSFANRLSLPEPWRGIRDDKLSELSGIPGCVFVHAAGFIGGNKTKAGALAMATKALTF